MYFSHRVSFQVNFMSIMYEAVEDSVSYCWIADVIMPRFNGQLACYDSRREAVSVFDHLSESAMGARPRSSMMRSFVLASLFISLT